MSTEQKTVQAAMIEVMKSIGAVRKDQRNQHQKFMFRGIDAVVNAVSPALHKAGVVVTPELQNFDRRTMQTSKGNAMNSVDVIVKYTFTGPAGDSIAATVPGEAFDSGDKATAKAMSVAFRTALLQALALPTDEPDPDEEVHNATMMGQPMTARQSQQGPPAQQGQPGPPQGQQEPPQQEQPQFDPNAQLQAAWNDPGRLASLRKWAAKLNNVPDGYLVTIRQREQELAQQNPQQ